MQLTEGKIFNRSNFKKVEKLSFLRDFSLILLGNFLIALGGKIAIPLQPIPITLGSLAVLFVAIIYGFRLGTLTVLIYVVLGTTNLPFFSIPNLNLTAGYLLGYIIAASFTGFLADRGWASHIFSTIIVALVGTILILFCGWITLSQSMSPWVAFNVGVKPFFLGGALKIIFLAFVVPAFWRFVQK